MSSMKLQRRDLLRILTAAAASGIVPTIGRAANDEWIYDLERFGSAHPSYDGHPCPIEYAGQKEFATTVAAKLATLPVKPERQALLTEAARLRRAIDGKAEPEQVAEIAHGLAATLLAAYPVPLAPIEDYRGPMQLLRSYGMLGRFFFEAGLDRKLLTESLRAALRNDHAVLVMQIASWYPSLMKADRFGCLSVVLLVLALATGPAANGMRLSTMTGNSETIALSAAQAMGPSADCGGSKSGARFGACSVHCTGVITFSTELVLLDDIAPAKQTYREPRTLIGYRARPDPYPPRSIVLS